jgi:hypothetical protein
MRLKELIRMTGLTELTGCEAPITNEPLMPHYKQYKMAPKQILLN